MANKGKVNKTVTLRMEGIHGVLPKDPILIEQALKSYKIEKAFAINNGNIYIIQVESKTATRLQKLGKLPDGTEIKMEVQESPHFCTVKVRSKAIGGLSDEQILLAIKNQGATHVRQILKGTEPTGEYIIKCNTKEPPKTFKIGLINLPVNRFYPSPRLCNKCQKYGHKFSECHGTPRCGICGQYDHVNECTSAPKCTNCGEGHAAKAKICIYYKEQTQIIKYSIDNGTTRAEAASILGLGLSGTKAHSTQNPAKPKTQTKREPDVIDLSREASDPGEGTSALPSRPKRSKTKQTNRSSPPDMETLRAAAVQIALKRVSAPPRLELRDEASTSEGSDPEII